MTLVVTKSCGLRVDTVDTNMQCLKSNRVICGKYRSVEHTQSVIEDVGLDRLMQKILKGSEILSHKGFILI